MTDVVILLLAGAVMLGYSKYNRSKKRKYLKQRNKKREQKLSKNPYKDHPELYNIMLGEIVNNYEESSQDNDGQPTGALSDTLSDELQDKIGEEVLKNLYFGVDEDKLASAEEIKTMKRIR